MVSRLHGRQTTGQGVVAVETFDRRADGGTPRQIGRRGFSERLEAEEDEEEEREPDPARSTHGTPNREVSLGREEAYPGPRVM